jgi:hypothetical protein
MLIKIFLVRKSEKSESPEDYFGFNLSESFFYFTDFSDFTDFPDFLKKEFSPKPFSPTARIRLMTGKISSRAVLLLKNLRTICQLLK